MMKKPLLLNATWICSALVLWQSYIARAQPAQKVTSATPIPIPAEVRARMGTGARTLSLMPLPAKAGAPPLLLHAWLVEDPSVPPPRADDETEAKLPFHVDFFYQRGSKWWLGTSVSYLSERPVIPLTYPEAVTYEARWLRPALKKGIVIVERTFMGSDSIVRLITLPEGVPLKAPLAGVHPQTQKFFQHNFGGQCASNITFGVEANRGMTLVDDYRSIGEHTVTTYGWRDGRWKEIKKQSEIYGMPYKEK